ncbi:hypothetical protein chiPu_0014961 [Chiloscyllium punctatum]|uniref:Uncharacterized protein n=1 Tax=Chiloscyllium punctatum TaxID=137246 RepID=A0A401T1I0_CHIPU|nr:hypothetical protein [Chiloscyllium punctatum]
MPSILNQKEILEDMIDMDCERETGAESCGSDAEGGSRNQSFFKKRNYNEEPRRLIWRRESQRKREVGLVSQGFEAQIAVGEWNGLQWDLRKGRGSVRKAVYNGATGGWLQGPLSFCGST